ncbi:MAG: amidophosphoribosyltransferase [Bdellovibrionaceae bacterium]|nr:amidophosphoribosyltransferase [Pseudobdellovibrionaceae bacterium]
MKSWKEECGVFGIWNHPEAARLACLGLYSMQHRGQESAGIVTLKEGEHIHHKGIGLVSDVFQEADLARLGGQAAIGHVRYSTTGQNLLTNAQPLTADLYHWPIALAHNGNIVNHDILRSDLKERGSIFQGTNDTEILLHLLSQHRSSDLVAALTDSLVKLEGAYSLVIMSNDKMIAIRDPWGFRPLVIGRKKIDETTWARVVASETCAFDLIGAQFEREIEPGEMFWVDEKGEHSKIFSHRERRAHCIFEHVYFSRPDSIVFGESVYATRKQFGRQLARETSVLADLVIPVPDSGLPASIGYSQESGIPFELGIIKNQYVGRTFIQPTQAIRDFGVKIKLNPQTAVLKDKKVIVIDDSLVRGTTSRKIVSLIRQAGAKEVHMRIASPPTVGPCYYGVDTPQKSQLIASKYSVEEIRQYVGADTLGYLSIEGLFQVMQSNSNTITKSKYCAACFDGKYPTDLFGLDEGDAK